MRKREKKYKGFTLAELLMAVWVMSIILAAAGVKRLGLTPHISEYLDPEDFIPAIGQGALAVEARENDPWGRELTVLLNHPASELTVKAERAFLARLEGGCQIPIAGPTLRDSAIS